MPTVRVDPVVAAETMRSWLYDGELIVLSRLESVRRFVDHTRAELAELFAPYEPATVAQHRTPEELAAMLGVWKPRFIHNPTSKQLVREIIEEAGFSGETTHYDLPKPRTSFPSGSLTTGIAYAFPWHRDSWYAAPAAQINWWLPIFDLRPDNAMGFDLNVFDQPVPNDSDGFDYYQTNKDRATAANQIGADTRSRPGARDWTPVHETVVLPSPGSVLLFAGAQLHRSMPNLSGVARYSVDFRTVERADVEAGVGAPLVDCHCSGTALRDFVGVRSGERFSEELVRRWYPEPPPADAVLVFDPSAIAGVGDVDKLSDARG